MSNQSKGSYNQGKGIVGKESRRRARGRQALVAGLALLARPLVVVVVGAPLVLARLLDAAEDLALVCAHVRGLVPVLRREVRERPEVPNVVNLDWRPNAPRTSGPIAAFAAGGYRIDREMLHEKRGTPAADESADAHES